MQKDIKTKQKKIVKRSYLARDFDGFKDSLITHAKTFFPNNLEDFTEAGLGGMFVDMISHIGDSLSFYLDHQFNELRWSDAVEVENLKKHIQLAGVETHGASPSMVYVSVFIRIPLVENGIVRDTLPIIKRGTRFRSSNGITFNLMEDINFAQPDTNKQHTYEFENNSPQTYPNFKTAEMFGLCVSGNIKEEQFSISDSFVPFRDIILSEQNVSLIESVSDSDGNIYYEVDNLSQDNVFSIVDNKDLATHNVEKVISLTPAPYRFTKYFDPQFLTTKLTFGGGDSMANDDDLLPDPADLSLPLYGKKTFSRFALDPNSLLRTNTLGVAPRNTTVKVKYRHGGGFSHNVKARVIREVTFLDLTFNGKEVTPDQATMVRSSVDVLNKMTATGGSPPPTINELRDQIPVARNSQSRIVTKEDLLARIYSLPAEFGRIFRASIAEIPDSNGQIEIAIISRDVNGYLVKFGALESERKDLKISSDRVKKNLKTYLEQFRLINDSYHICDAGVHNFGIRVSVIAVPGVQKANVAQSIISNLKNLLDIRKFHVNQPLSLGDINYIILSSEGVSSINGRVSVDSLSGVQRLSDGSGVFSYSSNSFIPEIAEERGFIFPKENHIFELKYPDFDIRVSVI